MNRSTTSPKKVADGTESHDNERRLGLKHIALRIILCCVNLPNSNADFKTVIIDKLYWERVFVELLINVDIRFVICDILHSGIKEH